jgi:hypothetical protein
LPTLSALRTSPLATPIANRACKIGREGEGRYTERKPEYKRQLVTVRKGTEVTYLTSSYKYSVSLKEKKELRVEAG